MITNGLQGSLPKLDAGMGRRILLLVQSEEYVIYLIFLTMTDTKDPLAALISNDVKATDRAKLAELLSPFLLIDEGTKEFGFLTSFSELKGNGIKIEILLAGAKARSLYFNVSDGLTPTEIIDTGIMAVGSVKSTLKSLFDSHQIKKDKEGRYYLPAHRITEVAKNIK